MPMPPYRVVCHHPDCDRDAEFKIAARWSDGRTSELKTYNLVCEQHLESAFRDSLRRHAACRVSAEETIEPPGIYRLRRASLDRDLPRATDLEQRLRQQFSE